LGEYWEYDLDTVFGDNGKNMPGSDAPGRDAKFCVSTKPGSTIPADGILSATTYQDLLKYRTLSRKIEKGEYKEGDADSLIFYNPEFFHTYRILGDYFKSKGEGHRAEEYYRLALEKEAPSAAERKSTVSSQQSAASK
jgi:hypothetical protein